MQGEAGLEPDRVQPILLRRGHLEGVRGTRHNRPGLLPHWERQQNRSSWREQDGYVHLQWIPI